MLEHGEPGYRPLRNAEATDRYTLRGGGPETYEPTFTFHGFRYVEVDGWPGDLDPDSIVAVVLHSDMERIGTFTCDNELLDQLHSNVVWGMRGNFLDVPTDCPQRDERLGWTGDLQVFAPTAAYLYDVRGMIGNWLEDLRAEQRDDGTVPIYVPTVPPEYLTRTAGWSDAVTVVPEALHTAYGDTGVLATMFDAMRAWVDFVEREAGPGRLWVAAASSSVTGSTRWRHRMPRSWVRTDSKLIATAYFARSAQIVSDVAGVLGRTDLEAAYADLAADIRRAFRAEYVTPHGRVMSDTATAYSIALEFGLIEDPDDHARSAARLTSCVAEWQYVITTGFLGTPVVLPALSNSGNTDDGVSARHPDPAAVVAVLGADGSDDDVGTLGQHAPRRIGQPGRDDVVQPLRVRLCRRVDAHHDRRDRRRPSPGYRRLRVAPVPGHGVTAATATLRTPYGPAACDGRWTARSSPSPSTYRRTRRPTSCVPACPSRSRSARATTSGPTTSPTRWSPAGATSRGTPAREPRAALDARRLT